MNKVSIVGIGPGHRDYILPIAYRKIEETDILVGAKRNLEIFSTYNKEQYVYDSGLQHMSEFIINNKDANKITVVVSGDTGFYSLLDYLKQKLGEKNIEVIPGISSFQYMFSKIKKSYKDYGLYSLHGREIDICKLLQCNKGIFLLTDNINSPDVIAKTIMENGYDNCKMFVGENLSYDNENIVVDTPKNISLMKFSSLSVVVIENNE
ncbi:MAG: precorrin-6y C5,15-methyltransferase (decarboxylating) subunit CbiE [Vallitalea sp.]|jgi:cobalt-precorrin-7 (C5)-methyltransferase|nr:precorrin-6y C5,15-methyltransferase (decarboxylating) subunit CbiE [Vallitalea sp.]